jgi:transposase
MVDGAESRGLATAPLNGRGRRRSITPPMLDALLQHLLEKPDLYLEEMEVFLWDEFEVRIPKSTISRTLRSAGWSKKTARRVAKEQNADLRELPQFEPPQF